MDAYQAAVMRARSVKFPIVNGFHEEPEKKPVDAIVEVGDAEETSKIEARLYALEVQIALLMHRQANVPKELPTEFSTIARIPTLQEIKQVMCAKHGLDPTEIVSECRERRIVWPRQVGIYLARKLTTASFPRIALHFGLKDHTTAMAAYRKVRNLRDADQELNAEIAALECKLTGQVA